ncbi:holo-ACP synthase [Sporosarcina thermotolerans]|uniref:Holo-[acyl-carrier-protein] synthase n=1 Tax=Sporosarcina thermotolerans TaxID=633404 RepID=A0AAW9ADB6_9BACL|nr:holo-ACP synthase [Sporosarcina thermotolerans]MDW0118060.1 holo-ACP synthase [Sporosarcina thermotolerans]
MIEGIGLDIVELDRITRLNESSDKFRIRILSNREQEVYEALPSSGRRTEFLAGRFAAKEAFAKARGTGIGKDCRFEQIEILPAPSGKPVLYFKDIEVTGFVSITHTRSVAAAQVILLKV